MGMEANFTMSYESEETQHKFIRKGSKGETEEKNFFKQIYENLSSHVLVFRNINASTNEFIYCNKTNDSFENIIKKRVQIIEIENNNREIIYKTYIDWNNTFSEVVKNNKQFEYTIYYPEKNNYYRVNLFQSFETYCICIFYNITCEINLINLSNIKALKDKEKKDINYIYDQNENIRSNMIDFYLKIIDEYTEGIYACYSNTYELLFINKMAFKILNKPQQSVEGKKCYEFLLGRSEPCEYCKLDNMNDKEFCIREHFSEKYNKNIILKGKRYILNNIDIHIEFMIDESDKVRSLNKLKINEEMLHAAIDHTNMYFWDLDIIKDISVQGYTCQRDFSIPEIVRNYSEVWPKYIPLNNESMEKYKLLLKKIRNGVEESSCELQIDLNGLPVWVDVKFTTVFDNNGKPIKGYFSANNISERKRAQISFKNEVSQKLVMENNLLAIACINLTQARVLEYSSVFKTNIKSYVVDGIKEISDIIAKFIPDKNDKSLYIEKMSCKNLLREYNNGKQSIKIEYSRLMLDGSIKWVSSTANLIENSISNDIIAYIYTRDIHDSKVLKRVMDAAISSDYDFITYLNVETQHYNTFLSNNTNVIHPYEKGRNYSEDYIEYIKACVIPEEIDRLKEMQDLNNICTNLKLNGEYYIYYNVNTFNGKIAKKRTHYKFIDSKCMEILIATSDITNIYEEQQRKNEVLNEALINANQANYAKSIFLSNMSHDIRTPMNAIIGMTNLAKTDIDNKEKIKTDLDIVETSAKHLLSLIDDVMDISKIESGKMVLLEERMDLYTELENVKEIIMPLIQKKSQNFHINCYNISHSTFLGDAMRLRRILINLLNNSNKFTCEKGSISLTVSEETFTNSSYSNFCFVIEDNGIGIENDLLENIYEPFVRNKDKLYEREGTGLGLSIVKNIVNVYGGNIKIDSTVGVGTKISVVLPLHIDKLNMTPQTIIEDNKSEFDFMGAGILIAEDNFVNQIVAKRTFENHNGKVIVAENGLICVEKFVNSTEGMFEYIFMDIQMPVMDGFEATRQIRNSNHPQAKTIPIIAMTANVFSEDVEKCYENGMNAHIGKPIKFGRISETLLKMTEIK